MFDTTAHIIGEPPLRGTTPAAQPRALSRFAAMHCVFWQEATLAHAAASSLDPFGTRVDLAEIGTDAAMTAALCLGRANSCRAATMVRRLACEVAAATDDGPTEAVALLGLQADVLDRATTLAGELPRERDSDPSHGFTLGPLVVLVGTRLTTSDLAAHRAAAARASDLLGDQGGTAWNPEDRIDALERRVNTLVDAFQLFASSAAVWREASHLLFTARPRSS